MQRKKTVELVIFAFNFNCKKTQRYKEMSFVFSIEQARFDGWVVSVAPQSFIHNIM